MAQIGPGQFRPVGTIEAIAADGLHHALHRGAQAEVGLDAQQGINFPGPPLGQSARLRQIAHVLHRVVIGTGDPQSAEALQLQGGRGVSRFRRHRSRSQKRCKKEKA